MPSLATSTSKLSEDFCKPLFGKKIFGKVMEKQMKDLLAASTDHVITDCGFAEEVQHLIESFPTSSSTSSRSTRADHDFKRADSRSYFNFPRPITWGDPHSPQPR